MKVAVIGGNGQLGRDAASAFADGGHEVTSLTHQEIEVSSLASVRESLSALRPELAERPGPTYDLFESPCVMRRLRPAVSHNFVTFAPA